MLFEGMEKEYQTRRGSNLVSKALTVSARTASVITSFIRPSRSDDYRPYWAEEGQSENIPTLRF